MASRTPTTNTVGNSAADTGYQLRASATSRSLSRCTVLSRLRPDQKTRPSAVGTNGLSATERQYQANTVAAAVILFAGVGAASKLPRGVGTQHCPSHRNPFDALPCPVSASEQSTAVHSSILARASLAVRVISRSSHRDHVTPSLSLSSFCWIDAMDRTAQRRSVRTVSLSPLVRWRLKQQRPSSRWSTWHDRGASARLIAGPPVARVPRPGQRSGHFRRRLDIHTESEEVHDQAIQFTTAGWRYRSSR